MQGRTAPRQDIAVARRAARPVLASSGAPAPVPLPQERELKLRLRPQDVAVLRARLDARAPPHVEEVDSVYLDTPDHRLAGARAALRLRALGKGRRQRWVQTLKTDDSGAAFSLRGEWETPAPGGRLHPGLLAQSPLTHLLAGADRDPIARLAPVFRTRFTRSTWNLAVYGAQIEVVIDVGRIEAGARSAAILEAELELKAGSAAAIWRLARDLSRGGARRADLCLLPYGDSKAARGYQLALGRAASPRNAGPVPVIAAAQSAASAARLLLAHDMVPLLANALDLQTDADPEFVHQARVCLRRMRANLDVLDVALPAALERGLHLWGNRLGAVRDWDVFCAQLLPRLLEEHGAGDPTAWARLAAAATRHRDAALLRLRGQLDGPAFAELALCLLQWTSESAPTRAGAKGPDRPVGEVAGTELRKRLRRVARAGLGLSRCSPQRQHRIRLQAKTVRYAIDALASVLPSKLRGAGRRALARFQDAAGRAQDALVVVAVAQRLTRSAPLRRAVAQWAAARRRKAIARAEKAAARLND
jgi:inorganic triphosphatase YgiF